MSAVWAKLRQHASWFFSNWKSSDASFPTKLWLTVRNRTKGIVTGKMCCGNTGQPGC